MAKDDLAETLHDICRPDGETWRFMLLLGTIEEAELNLARVAASGNPVAIGVASMAAVRLIIEAKRAYDEANLMGAARRTAAGPGRVQ